MNWRVGVVGSPVAHSLVAAAARGRAALAGLTGTSTRVELTLANAEELVDLLRGAFRRALGDQPAQSARPSTSQWSAARPPSEPSRSTHSSCARGSSVGRAPTARVRRLAYLRLRARSSITRTSSCSAPGGAASAIVDALVSTARSVAVLGRTESKVEALARSLLERLFGRTRLSSGRSRGEHRPYRWARRRGGRPPGRHARDDRHRHHLRTSRVRVARRYEEAGCRTMNGLAMLAFQAALQMEWWWGVTLEGAQLLEALL